MCYLLGRCRLVFLSRDVPMLLNNDGDILDKGALRIMPGDIINVEPSDAPLTGTPADSVAVRLWEVSTDPPPPARVPPCGLWLASGHCAKPADSVTLCVHT